MSVYYLTITPANPATTYGELKLKRVSYRNQNEEREPDMDNQKHCNIFKYKHDITGYTMSVANAPVWIEELISKRAIYMDGVSVMYNDAGKIYNITGGGIFVKTPTHVLFLTEEEYQTILDK